MAVYKELDPLLAWKAIEGYENALEGPAKSQELFYSQFTCPRCKIGLTKEFDGRHAFSDPDVLIARALLRCPNCRYLIDPHSNVILEFGDASKIPHGIIPTIGG
jgi:hypothetical protein